MTIERLVEYSWKHTHLCLTNKGESQLIENERPFFSLKDKQQYNSKERRKQISPTEDDKMRTNCMWQRKEEKLEEEDEGGGM